MQAIKHNKIFSLLSRPDWRLAQRLIRPPRKYQFADWDGRARARRQGIDLVTQKNPKRFLGPLLPEVGIVTRRSPDGSEAADINYGTSKWRRKSLRSDLGQTVSSADRACVAVEA